MLDILVCAQLISKQVVKQQSLYDAQLYAAGALWNRVLQDIHLQEKLKEQDLIGFSYPLETILKSQAPISEYSVCGIDGSQIYPDRHEGFSEYLINIGSAHFTYSKNSSAALQSRPLIFSGIEQGVIVTPDFVNCQRTDYELRQAAEIAQQAESTALMFDGALMFWHLQSDASQKLFLQKYLDSLTRIKNLNKLYMGYISASHSRELITLLEAAAILTGRAQTFEYLVDTDIMRFFLKPGDYTQLFKSQSAVAQLHPADLEPLFIYLNVGSEIARVEVPAYCTEPSQLEYLVQIILDQSKKGNGYPVALSEAHEQAVVKAADREFFYTLLRMQHQSIAHPAVSLKLSSKRSASV